MLRIGLKVKHLESVSFDLVYGILEEVFGFAVMVEVVVVFDSFVVVVVVEVEEAFDSFAVVVEEEAFDSFVVEVVRYWLA